jgi:hypothetical protein
MRGSPFVVWVNARRVLVAVGVVLLCVVPARLPAAVTPATLIDQQVIKPNMLVVFDTSTSMMNSPGDPDVDSNEVGPDCDDGDDYCRTVGIAGRCFYAGTGAMGAGVTNDDTKCHSDAECRVGYCKGKKPKSCDEDNDCSSGTCKGYCSNNLNTSCNNDSNCGTGKCVGVCSSTSGTVCTSDAQCDPGEACTVRANDVCVTSGSGSKVQLCKLGMNRCRSDADCTAITGDSCGNATSRLTIAKRVVSNIVGNYYNTVNFGLMTFYQKNYFPYYTVSGSIVNHDITRFMSKDQLEAFDCWTKNDGPAPTCSINGNTYNRRGSDDSRYRIKTGSLAYDQVDNKWCGLWCTLPGGTGYYYGSYYTYTDPQASFTSDPPVIQSTYLGKTYSASGKKYMYWDTPTTIRNINGIYGKAGGLQPITVGGNTNYCCVDCGGRSDMVPFMNTTNNTAAARAMATQIIARMDKASFGGLTSEGFTPTGCALWNNTNEKTDTNNAYSYLAKVKATDTLGCRNNYVLLVTDGHPSYANELNCSSAACSAADPSGAGCTCHSVLAAQQLKNAGVNTYVVAFSAGTTNAYAQATSNNIAKAGGTKTAFFAIRESELEEAMVLAIYDAAKGSYSTSPAAGSSGTQSADSVSLGTMLLDTRVDFPGWTGNLLAYETKNGTPTLAWDARTVSFDPSADAAGPDFWKKRRVWTSNGTTMVKVDVDASSGVINNAATLKGLGLGATTAEASLIARWLLGDPAMKNPAVLGAILNSTPIDIGPPGKSNLPGGMEFWKAYENRPSLIYVGSSDGMLHAFFSKETTVGTVTYRAGQEAFAYIPQTMLPVITKVFAQGGQKPDPRDHIYGLANSAKVKSLCIQNCTTAAAVWRTMLVMTYGWGGTEAFMLDITNPFDASGVKQSTAPAPLVWSTQYLSNSASSAYDNALGLTTSVPAFYYAKSATKNDFRIIFGSYTLDDATGNTAKVLVNSSVLSGVMTDGQKINPANSCDQSFGLMSDVAVAKNYGTSEEGQLTAAYYGDTWGNLYRYVPKVDAALNTLTTGDVSTVEAFGCAQPVHYAPMIAQLDREISTNRAGEIYIVQVTNSALDLETKYFPPSKMIFRKDNSINGVVTPDTTFGTGGKIVLNAGTAAELCGVTNADGIGCLSALPATARPNATPIGVLRTDGAGFIVIATWYDPAVNSCSDGVTYLTIHEYNVSTGLKQRFAMKLASEPVTSAAVVGNKLLFATQAGVTDLTPQLPATIKFTADSGLSDRMVRTGWVEMP